MKRTKNSNEETEAIKEIALLNKVGEILNLSDGIVEEMSIQGEKDSIMKLIRPKILSLLELFKDTFCQTKEEEEKFIIFSFILWRSIYECSEMIQIDGKKGSDGFFLLKECLEKLVDKSFAEHQV